LGAGGGFDGQGGRHQQVVVSLTGIHVEGKALVFMEGGAGKPHLPPELLVLQRETITLPT
jgi:hypothetical protein